MKINKDNDNDDDDDDDGDGVQNENFSVQSNIICFKVNEPKISFFVTSLTCNILFSFIVKAFTLHEVTSLVTSDHVTSTEVRFVLMHSTMGPAIEIRDTKIEALSRDVSAKSIKAKRYFTR